ncbi:heme-binding-like protein [Scenedesmus sp. PABB004]|nr:heme-binding-like protein [Scenedesmus sp. PABB004]
MVKALATLARVTLELHDVRVEGECDVTTTWTMALTPRLLPWRPTLLFSGRSFYKVEPGSGLITYHRDVWDSVPDSAFPSAEAVGEVMRQLLRVELTPELETPDGAAARRDGGQRQWFHRAGGLHLWRQRLGERMEMTTPVFTRRGAAGAAARGPGEARVTMEFPMERKFDLSSLPAPTSSSRVAVGEVRGSYVAAARFSGVPFAWEVDAAERQLRAALARDGLEAAPGVSLARYNEPFVLPPLRRNEVLIDLPSFAWP